MSALSTIDRGWPFLVAAGRRRDYTVLLAPAFLVDALDYGVLEQVVGPGLERDAPRIVRVDSPGGRRLTLAYATHLLAAGDIAGPAGAPADPCDEHGRPLRLSYGFAVRDAGIVELAPADIDAARETALTVYRRFLRDEERFAVVPSDPFPVRSRTATDARTGAATRTPAVPARSGVPRRRTVVWVALAAVAVLLALTAAMWPRSPAPPGNCVGQPRTTTSPATTPMPSAPTGQLRAVPQLDTRPSMDGCPARPPG